MTTTRMTTIRPPASRIALFDAARQAGLSPQRSARYVHHVRLYESQGRTPLTPAADALAVATATATIRALNIEPPAQDYEADQ